MAKSIMNLQDSFLNQVRKDNTEINLILLDGTTMTGVVRGFDSFTVIVAAKGVHHLIYKHAIAQIISKRFNTRRDEAQREGEGRARSGRSGSSERDRARAASPRSPTKPDGFNTLNLSRVVVPESVES